MGSRKRNKGKERKAKKQEKENIARAELCDWRRWARGEDENNKKVIECDHECTVEIPDSLDHPVCRFMDGLFSSQISLFYLEAHSNLWKDENNRIMTRGILISIGTTLLLLTNHTAYTKHTAHTILLLENYDEKMKVESIYMTRTVGVKITDLHGGNMRDVLKFFSKRTSCSCLKKMHSDARKTMPKQGFCQYCNAAKERARLSVCSRCRIQQYCSRECQVAGWLGHKRCCDEYVRAHSQFNDDVG